MSSLHEKGFSGLEEGRLCGDSRLPRPLGGRQVAQKPAEGEVAARAQPTSDLAARAEEDGAVPLALLHCHLERTIDKNLK